MGRTSLVVLYSKCWEILHRQSPRVDMPQVGVLQLPSRVPPKVEIAYAYHSLSVLVVRPNHRPGMPGKESCGHGTAGVPVRIQLIL
jgi:hypothetical protein